MCQMPVKVAWTSVFNALRTHWRDHVSWLAVYCLELPSDKIAEVSEEREVWECLLRLMPP